MARRLLLIPSRPGQREIGAFRIGVASEFIKDFGGKEQPILVDESVELPEYPSPGNLRKVFH